MVALNRWASCRDAEPYYYDLLLDPGNSAIPDSIAFHAKNCAYCQEALRRLKGLLAESETAGADARLQEDAGLIDALSLHFEYIGESVTCAHVKPFLPALSMPSEQIRIPTPITVHLDNCAQCGADLDAISGLHLHAEQLARLSRLLGERPSGDSAMCRRAEASIAALGSDSPTGIAAEIWDHLCVCPQCRAGLYEGREAMLEERQAAGPEQGVSACEGLCPAELFDYVIPYGLTAGGRDSAAAAHVWACPACLERMQALHRTLFDIAERADSDTVTVYAAKDQRTRARAGGDDRYARYGIDVRILEGAHKPTTERLRPAVERQAMRKRRILRPAIKPVAKIAALAAVIPLAILLFVQTRSASGTGPEEIANAFARTANVHVKMFHPSQPQPTQELWIAREPDIFMMTRGSSHVLYNMRARTKTTADPVTGITGPVVLDGREYEGARNIIRGCLGLPLAGIPLNREWQFVARDDIRGTDVYTLTWAAETLGNRAYRVRWEVVVDSRDGLPNRTQIRHKYSSDAPWQDRSECRYDYLTEADIRTAIAEHFPGEAAAPI